MLRKSSANSHSCLKLFWQMADAGSTILQDDSVSAVCCPYSGDCRSLSQALPERFDRDPMYVILWERNG